MLANRLTRKRMTTKLAVLAVFFIAGFFILPHPVTAAIQNEQVLESRPVSEGLILEKRAVTINGGRVLTYILRADLTNQFLKIDTLLGAGQSLDKNAKVTDMAVKAGAVAAVNADFFQMSESGRPIGMTYKDGQMITSPPLREDMPGWAITKDGVFLIELFNFSGKVKAQTGVEFPLSGVNEPSYFQSGGIDSYTNGLLMYNRYWGTSSRGKISNDDNVIEVFVENDVVTEIMINQPGKVIPQGGYVLAARGTAAEFINTNVKVGDRIAVDYSVSPQGENLRAGTGGWSVLVDGGQVMSNSPGDISGSNARTVIGYSANKKTLFLVSVEKSAVSKGMSLDELAEYLVRLGISKALNLDGGGSTTLAVRPLGDDKPVLMNRPQREVQRLLPTAIGFFSTAPRGNLAGLVMKFPDQMFPGDSITVTAKGYDSHFNPYPVVMDNVKLAVDSGPGSINAGIFTASTTGLATLSADLNGVRATKSVKVLGSGDLNRITVEPSSIDVKPGGSVNLKVSAVDHYGTVYALNPKNYSVTMDPVLGQLENSIYTAQDKPVTGEIRFALGDYTAVVPVKVKSDDQATFMFTPGQPGTLTLGDLSLGFPGKAFDTPATIAATFGGEFESPIPERYDTISTAQLALEGGSPFSLKEPAALFWRYQSGQSGRIAVLQLLGNRWQEIPSRVDAKNNRVICRVWELAPLALVWDHQSAVVFSDMKGHWASGPVSKLATAGVISGYPGNKFDPSRQITRAEFVVMFCKALGWQPVQTDEQFRDKSSIPGWSSGYVMAAVNRGVLSGYEDHTFRPSNKVTRSEMAAMLIKALSLPPGETGELAEAFSDSKTIPTWAKGPVEAVYAAGIMKGDSNERFKPVDRATRAESAAMVDSMLNYLFAR